MSAFEIIDKNHTRLNGIVYEHTSPSNWEISELQSILIRLDEDMRIFAAFLVKIGWKAVQSAQPQPGVA